MIGRVNTNWALADMHAWSRGKIVLPDGRLIVSAWPKVTDPCKVMPISFNHYDNTYATCMAKALHGWKQANHRTTQQCQTRYDGDLRAKSRELAGNLSLTQDRSIAQYMPATRKLLAHLFPDALYAPAAARVISCDGDFPQSATPSL